MSREVKVTVTSVHRDGGGGASLRKDGLNVRSTVVKTNKYK